MPLAFEYDARKAASNLTKHGLSFAEAMTIFNDPLAQTFPDDLHSEEEDRSITIGLSSRQRLLFVSHLETDNRIRLIGAPAWPTTPKEKPMKNSNAALETDALEADPLESRPLDLSKAVRGKYYKRVQEATNVVLIAPDLMEMFPDSEAVNEALRTLKNIADRTSKQV